MKKKIKTKDFPRYFCYCFLEENVENIVKILWWKIYKKKLWILFGKKRKREGERGRGFVVVWVFLFLVCCVVVTVLYCAAQALFVHFASMSTRRVLASLSPSLSLSFNFSLVFCTLFSLFLSLLLFYFFLPLGWLPSVYPWSRCRVHSTQN